MDAEAAALALIFIREQCTAEDGSVDEERYLVAVEALAGGAEAEEAAEEEGPAEMAQKAWSYLEKAAPGPPPRPGLTWRESTHRWVREGEAGGETARPAQAAPPAAEKPQPNPEPKPETEAPAAEEAGAGPSKPSQRKKGAKPPVKPMVPPPPPQGSSRAPKNAEGRPTTGYTASGLNNTHFGDFVESLMGQLGMRSILPEGRRSNKSVAEEGSSIDVEYDHSGYAFEVKAVCVEATEYKAAPKKDEIEGKKEFARRHQLRPAMMVVVVDVTAGKALAYWQEGIAALKLKPDKMEGWHFAGEVSFGAFTPLVPQKKEP